MRMIADGPWYTSAVTVLTLALVVLAALTIVITFYLWRIGPPRRQVIYSLPTATSLLTRHSEYMGLSDIAVNYKDEHGTEVSVRDPYFVRLYVESKSRRDISEEDFSGERSLVFHFGTPIIAPVGQFSGQAADLSDGILTLGESTVELSPCLIRKGPVLSLDLLLSGRPHLTHKSPLKNVDVVLSVDDDIFGWKQGTGCLSFIALMVALTFVITPFTTSWAVRFYKAHTPQDYERWVRHWVHIELIVIVILAILAAAGVVVGVVLSQRNARSNREAERLRP